ncbi:phage tail protein [Shewanella decolorationis]|uniref:Phage tail collar domain-containing protein n=1 Tax=Shewanella decolorationis S12 TaxID=1353536 RepID=A0ABN0PPU9_9GAMM|nr:tail fiber protein [Shewanella decolorationis]ESE42199.1 phage tail collar domain-containing protein [Shewanella decolorationis S12]GLR31920.1 tail Collar domain-containing protein [Shewanella decolorationis]
MSEPFIGQISMFAGNFAPRGWAFCNGQLLSIAQYTALFSIIGTTYGGNGQTTFALPNMQGRVPVHQGQSPGTSQYVLGEMAGQETVTLTSSQMPIHNHAVDLTGTGNVSVALGASTANGNTSTPSPTTVPAKVASGLNALNAFSSAAPNTNLLPVNTTTSVHLTGATTNTGNSLPVRLLQPYLTVNFIIALEGIFPSRN